jgi:hypothetical protein
MRFGLVLVFLLAPFGAQAALLPDFGRFGASDCADHESDPTNPCQRKSNPAVDFDVELRAGAFAQLERNKIIATSHGETHEYEGVDLLAALRASGVEPVESLHGDALSRLLVAEARDGYRAVFAMAELDPTLGKRGVRLVDRMDGKPLPPTRARGVWWCPTTVVPRAGFWPYGAYEWWMRHERAAFEVGGSSPAW